MSQTKIRPLHSNIVVLPDTKETKTPTGLIIPDTVQSEVSTGTVYAVASPSPKFQPLVKEGDRVRYGQYAGVEIPLEELSQEATSTDQLRVGLLMPEDQVLCVIE